MFTEKEIETADALSRQLVQLLQEDDDTFDIASAITIITIMQVGMLVQLEPDAIKDVKMETEKMVNDMLQGFDLKDAMHIALN